MRISNILEVITWIIIFIICFFVRISFGLKLVLCIFIAIIFGFIASRFDNGGDNNVDKTV